MISQPIEVLQLILLILTAMFFIIAIEYRRLPFAVISFAVANAFLSMIFFMLGAPYVAVFNFTVFSGAVAILFLATMNLDTPIEGEQEQTKEEATE